MSFFFFQAEDGIRDLIVTGVQTCALPIFPPAVLLQLPRSARDRRTPAARYKEKLRAPGRHIPRSRPREGWFCRRATRSHAREFERVLPAEKIVLTARRSLAR